MTTDRHSHIAPVSAATVAANSLRLFHLHTTNNSKIVLQPDVPMNARLLSVDEMSCNKGPKALRYPEELVCLIRPANITA
jgi:hypothetical protein